ncbi:MAG: hypothetical protein V1716_02680 [Candidatus Uhrbacteria bacterium]
MDSIQPTDLELAIVRTLAWFSLFEYPLTSFEIWKWLKDSVKKYSFFEVESLLETSVWLRERLVKKVGFWTLKSQSIEIFVASRQERFLNAAKKYKKLRLAARYFSLFPFVQAVFACNTLAWHNTTSLSDIDLFIVVKPGTVWTSRLLLVFPFAFLKKRPIQNPFFPTTNHSITPSLHHSITPDPFCFSFFTTEDNLNFKNLLLPDGDPYFSYWLASLVPIFDRENILEKILANNVWLKEPLPNSFSRARHSEISPRSFCFGFLSYLSFFETWFRQLQQKLLPCEIKDVANLDSKVIINDQMLKFHTNDRRVHFRDEWQKKIAKIL